MMKSPQEYFKMSELSKDILAFVDKYAGISPNWDPEFDDEDEKYTSPDASEMIKCAHMLKSGTIPDYCHSEWGSGGYKPYTSTEGRQEHDSLIQRIKERKNEAK
jgi:hypothetical protein